MEENHGTANSEVEVENLPTISIVTPSFNQGRFIEETIRSVVLQEYPRVEYIVIDGNSTDETTRILEKYDPWIDDWVSEDDRGQTHAINKGIERCTGDIFNWVNSDDALARGALKAVGRHMGNLDVHVLGGYARRFNNEDGETESYVRLQIRDRLEHSVVRSHFRQLPTYYRLDVVRSLGRLNESLQFIMDTELWTRYLLNKGQDRIKLIDDVLGHFRLHGSSKTVSGQDAFREEKYSLDKQLYRSAFEGLPLACCAPETEREAVLRGKFYNTKNLRSSCLKSYLLQSFAFHCRGRISRSDRLALVGRALLNYPARSPQQYRSLFGEVLFPELRSWYRRWKSLEIL